MVQQAPIRSRRPVEVQAPPTTRIWGLDARSLHDRYWASKRVQVVRAGAGAGVVDAPGPALYLLIDDDEAMLFGLGRALKRLNWMKPRLLRVRAVDAEPGAYAERVVADENGRLSAVRRQYGARTRATAQALLTPEKRLARRWAQGPGGRSGRRALLRSVEARAAGVVACSGRVFRLRGDRRSEALFLGALMERWKAPEAVIDGVYSFAPGVWLHESVRMAPGTRFVAPVWIGAGWRLSRGATVVGPRVVPDEDPPDPPPKPVDWRDMRPPGWKPASRRRRLGRRSTKRAFDIAFSAGVLAATAPLFPILMAAIAAEDGWPPFFVHRRQTAKGREFPCLKFRTMRKDAERIKERLAAQNQADGPQFFIRDDPRLLKVGRLLRRFHLDELPQFLNVLVGHMSVVGPRPSPDKENQYCPAWREARLSVRPGVTGLWQVRCTRQPQTDFQEWIRYDLEYVQHQSWRLDLWIIMQTLKKTLGG